MEEVIPGASFKCPNCQENVLIALAVLEDNEIRLIGKCETCNHVLRFRIDELTATLLGQNPVKGNGQVH